MIFVGGRQVIDVSSGEPVPVAWDQDGTPFYRDDPPRFFDVLGYEGDEYDDDIGMRDTIPAEVMR